MSVAGSNAHQTLNPLMTSGKKYEQTAWFDNIYTQGAIVFALLLCARWLAIYSVYFYEGDEISIAAGIAALVRDNVGALYHYTPQLGYYRLVEYIDLLFGGRIALIPPIMKGLSAIAGALIPTLGLLAFRNELTIRERYLAALSLAVNPIIWKSSQYGNTAIPAVALTTASVVILSNNPGSAGRIAALALLGLGTLVRGDMVLLVPIVLFLLYRNVGSIGRALKWSLGFAAIMAGVYGLVFAFDSRIDNVASAVANHTLGPTPTNFWEYLLWSMSPIPFLFAIWGMHSLLDSRSRLFGSLLIWCLPILVFYFPSATIPRYFLVSVIPLSIACAVGLHDVAARLRNHVGSLVAWTAVTALASAHLIFSLGHFSLTNLKTPLQGANLPYIQAGEELPTGALIYQTYLDPGVFAWSFRKPFGDTTAYWEPETFAKTLSTLADPAAPKRTVIVLLSGGWTHAFLYHTQEAGARYISRTPGEAVATETWMEIGNSRVMTVSWKGIGFKAVDRFDITTGDEIWVIGSRDSFPDEDSLRKMPSGLSLETAETFNRHVRVFHVTRS